MLVVEDEDAGPDPSAIRAGGRRSTWRPPSRRAVWFLVVALSGFAGQMGLQHLMRPYAIRQIYFHGWSSDALMQTVSIEDLRDEPLRSLWNLHIQPPALDTIRAILAQVWATPASHVLVEKVDQSLYVLWAMAYGVCGALIFLWLSHLVPVPIALVAAIAFLAHPAAIFYATLLDTTLISATFMLWAYYVLWRCRGAHPPIPTLAVATLALFFTRSLFQWPAFPVFACSLALLGVPARKVGLFFLVAGGIAGLYVTKQYIQFGIPATSSFGGLGLCHSLGCASYWPPDWESKGPSGEAAAALPRVLVRKTKLLGTRNFNVAPYLEVNAFLMEQATRRLAEVSLWELRDIGWKNAVLYFRPSSSYSEHAIVDRIPAWYRSTYDRVFSAPILPALVAVAAALWVVRAPLREYAPAIGLMLPAAFVFVVSVFGEWGENMRFKFFLEPVLFVFIAAQLYRAGAALVHRARPARRATAERIV